MASITRKRQGSRADRREEARGRLLEAGEGFTELSVERIVAEAGISSSTFYVYFRERDETGRAALRARRSCR